MTLLLRDEPKVEAAAAEPVAVVRACDSCGEAMSADQDWCLSCGTAAPGRIGSRPGLRAAATVVSLTLALMTGAVAASYAALSSDAQREATAPAPADVTPVAQVPPPPPAAPPAPTTTQEAPAIDSGAAKAPRFTPPPADTNTDTGVTGVGTGTQTGTGTGTGTGTTAGNDTSGETEPEVDKTPQLISLGADTVELYDPYERASDKGDPADAYDDDADTSWKVTTPESDKMAVGLVVDLEKARGVKALELATDTPGFRVETYGATGSELPPDVLDTRWAHIVDRSRVDETGSKDRNKAEDGKERIVLGGGTKKYRYVLLWFTTPPDDGPTVRIADLKLFD